MRLEHHYYFHPDAELRAALADINCKLGEIKKLMAMTEDDLNAAIAALPTTLAAALEPAIETAVEAAVQPIINQIQSGGTDQTAAVAALQALPGQIASSISSDVATKVASDLQAANTPPPAGQ
jgi:hypothetical protein